MSQSGGPKIAGSEKVGGSPSRLLLDLDTEEAVARCMLLLPLVAERWELASVRVWPSATKGTHMQIDLELRWDSEWPVPVFGVQAILGSDEVRERLGVEEWVEGEEVAHCNYLWKPPKDEEGRWLVSRK